jgi:hypothetical protein
MSTATKRIRTALSERQKADAAVKVLAALLSNPQVLKIDLDETPTETARKVRRCVQLSWDAVRDLNSELLFQLHDIGDGVDLEHLSDVAKRS